MNLYTISAIIVILVFVGFTINSASAQVDPLTDIDFLQTGELNTSENRFHINNEIVIREFFNGNIIRVSGQTIEGFPYITYSKVLDDKIDLGKEDQIDQKSNDESQQIIEEIKERLSSELPEYMIPSYFIILDEFPITSGGKVDYKSLPKPQLDFSGLIVSPRNDTEAKLIKLWAEVLVLEEDVIGTKTDFFEIGGHSLKATVLLSKVHKEFNIKIPLIELFKKPTIQEFSLLIDINSNEMNKVDDDLVKERMVL